MEKKSRAFASVSFILRKNRLNKIGEYPICIRITKDRVVAITSTNYSSTKGNWNPKSQRPNDGHSKYEELYDFLTDAETKLTAAMRELSANNKSFTSTDLIDNYNRPKEEASIFVLDYYNRIIGRMRQKHQFSTKTTYVNAFKWLDKFHSMSTLRLDEINLTFLENLLAFMIEEKAKEKSNGGTGYFEGNTLYGYFKNYKALMNKAMEEEIISEHCSNFHRFKLSQFKRKKNPRPISVEEMEKIMNLQLKPYSRIWNNRNYIVFSFLGNGINFVDMATLKHSDITNGKVDYVRHKTGVQCAFKLNALSQKIIDYYDEETYGDYVFPILLKDYGEEGQFIRINTARGDMNDDLKTIQSLCGIEAKLTFYTGRHTFSNVARDLGFSDEVIGENLGHSNGKSLKNYLRSLPKANAGAVSDRVFQTMTELGKISNN